MVFISFIASPLNPYMRKEQNIMMGTFVETTLFGKKRLVNEAYSKMIQYAFELELLFSSKKDEGVVKHLNDKGELTNNQYGFFELRELIKKSLQYYDELEGAFDPSLGKLVELWNFDGTNVIPSSELIAQARQHIGITFLQVQNDSLKLQKGIALDLGAIAKGEIISQMASLLHREGVKDFIINAGGDIIVSGLYNHKRKWQIALQHPRNKEKFLGFINLSNSAIVTSGDYERFFFANDGRRYHHIVDPETGFPANSGVLSVTVICHDAARADAYSTGLFVLGKDKALAKVNQTDDIEAIICVLNDEGEVDFFISNGLGVRMHQQGINEFFLNNDSLRKTE